MDRMFNRRTLLGGAVALAGVAAVGGPSRTMAASPTRMANAVGRRRTRPALGSHAGGRRRRPSSSSLFGGRDADVRAARRHLALRPDDSGGTPIDAAGPSPRFGHAVAVDQKARTLYLFGGQSADDSSTTPGLRSRSTDAGARSTPARARRRRPATGSRRCSTATGA